LKPQTQATRGSGLGAGRVIAALEGIPAAVWILGLPLIVTLTTTFTIGQASFLDPYVYAAYIHDFSLTAQKYGQTYYSERIAFTIVDMVFIRLFGIETGYLVARWLMFTVATASAFTIARRYFGTSVAIFAVAWLCFIPWLGRSVWWTYIDGFATAHLLAAMALLLVPERGRIYWHAAAGFFWMLAINAQVFMLAIGGLFLIPWAMINARQGLGWLMRHAGAVLVGMVACYGALALIYASLAPEGFKTLGTATLSMSKWSFSGGLANWFVSMWVFLERGIWIPLLLPIFLLIGTPVWLAGKRRAPSMPEDPLPAFLIYGALVAALCLGLHFGFSFGILSLFYYTIYLLPACMLILIGVAGRAVRTHRTLSNATLLILSALLSGVWLFQGLHSDMIRLSRMETGTILLGLSLVALVGVAIRGAITVAAMAAITFLAVAEYASGTYNVRNSNAAAAQVEWDVYRGAIAFQKWVGEAAPVRGDLRFWYPAQGDAAPLNSIQSIFLWGYSLLTFHPYPEITPEVKEAMLAREFLCLISLDEAGLNDGLAAMAAQGIAFEEVARFAHDGEAWGFRSVMVRLPKQP
jgi:hypothetical protein